MQDAVEHIESLRRFLSFLEYSILEKIIKAETGTALKLKIKNGEEAGGSQNKKPEKAEHNPDEKKLFNKVVEVFDGEILR